VLAEHLRKVRRKVEVAFARVALEREKRLLLLLRRAADLMSDVNLVLVEVDVAPAKAE
jgi:hypothetical protein